MWSRLRNSPTRPVAATDRISGALCLPIPGDLADCSDNAENVGISLQERADHKQATYQRMDRKSRELTTGTKFSIYDIFG